MSIQTFCVNGVIYRVFDKGSRNPHKDVVPVQIVDGPEAETYLNKTPVAERSEESDAPSYRSMTGIKVLKCFQAFFRKFDEGCRDFKK